MRLLRAVAVSWLLGCSSTTSPDPGVPFVAVTTGRLHSCALTARHEAYCWGRNAYGALGDGTTRDSSAPVRVAGAFDFEAITAGFDYTCGIATNGAAYCWGANFNGELGDGTTTNRADPVAVTGGLAFRSLSAGESHTCGVTTGGTSYCWGAPLGPAPGGGVLPNLLRPTALSGPGFTAVSSGYEIACAVTVGGTQYCWGLYPPGVDFTDSTVPSTAVPAPVGGGVTLRSISAGHKHACGLAPDGRAYCWGQNQTGQVGDSGSSYANDPVAVAGAHTFASVSAHSPSHSCGVTDSRSAFCWGANHLGQLGNGSDSTSLVPKQVAGALAFTDVTTGFNHTCGLTAEGDIYCWGYGGFGQLGSGTFTDTRQPQAVRR